jgi:hypothetical protein
MAFTFDAKVSAGVTTSTGLTVSHTAGGSSNLLVCGIGIRGSQTITSITYAGAALSLAAETGYSLDFERTAIYYKVGNATGANNLVVSLSGSVAHAVSVSTYIAASAPASLDVTAVTNGPGGGGGTPISTAVSGAVGGLGVDCCSTEAASTPPLVGVGGDQTVLHNFGTGSWGITSTYELAPSATESFDYADPGDVFAHVVAIFKESGGGAATSFAPHPRHSYSGLRMRGRRY